MLTKHDCGCLSSSMGINVLGFATKEVSKLVAFIVVNLHSSQLSVTTAASEIRLIPTPILVVHTNRQ